MKLYVDGNTLLGYLDECQDPIVVPDSRERTRENLARWLARFCQARDADGVLVFDGQRADDRLAPRRQVGRVTVLAPPYGREARAEIAGPANRDARSGRVTVVTDDWRLAQALDAGGAKVQGCEQFVASVRRFIGKDTKSLASEPDEKFSGVVDEEVEFWMEYFDMDEEN